MPQSAPAEIVVALKAWEPKHFMQLTMQVGARLREECMREARANLKRIQFLFRLQIYFGMVDIGQSIHIEQPASVFNGTVVIIGSYLGSTLNNQSDTVGWYRSWNASALIIAVVYTKHQDCILQ
eukprot:5777529-Amphidinium_carterae.1